MQSFRQVVALSSTTQFARNILKYNKSRFFSRQFPSKFHTCLFQSPSNGLFIRQYGAGRNQPASTIFHLSSGFGALPELQIAQPCSLQTHALTGLSAVGVAVVRLSGPEALSTLNKLTLPPHKSGAVSANGRFPARKAMVCSLYGSDGRVIDARALALYFPAPASFTGQDVAELHVHGD
jgi:hypothetical protein